MLVLKYPNALRRRFAMEVIHLYWALRLRVWTQPRSQRPVGLDGGDRILSVVTSSLVKLDRQELAEARHGRAHVECALSPVGGALLDVERGGASASQRRFAGRRSRSRASRRPRR
jgi:hypothetical protein